MRAELAEETERPSQYPQIFNTGSALFSMFGISGFKIARRQYRPKRYLTLPALRLMKMFYRTLPGMLAALPIVVCRLAADEGTVKYQTISR